jgi:hypothetical protein
MSHVVYFRGSRAQARQIVQGLTSLLTGRTADSLGVARGVFLAIGFAALSDIKADFVRKSRGETGEDGVQWAPLSKEYLAYQRRFGPGEKTALRKAAGITRGQRYGVGGPGGNNMGLLTKAQQKRWKAIFARALQRLLLTMPAEAAKARAGQIAWATLKREGAKTLLEVFGNRQVEINRDSGILLNSLSPGELSFDHYDRPGAEGGEQQVFSAIANGVIVGTNVPYAAAVNKRRPFLPERAPQAWLERWAAVASQALLVGARLLFQAGGQPR